jgi:molecular chaperone GrpE
VKETEIRKIELIRYANEDLIREILPVLDNFKTAFRQIPEKEKDSAWVVGFSYIKKQLEDVLKNHNVEEIKTVGEQFDPVHHEAVEHVQRDGVKSGEVIEERKAGYKLNGKVIQVAKVVVAE